MNDAAWHSRLRELRVAAGLQQQELAERVGVSRQTLSALESGGSIPATSIALQLARVLGCRVEEIFWLGAEGELLDAALVRPDQREPAARPVSLRVALAAVEERWVAHPLDGEGGGPGAFVSPADGVVVSEGRRAAEKRDSGRRTAADPAGLRVQPLREVEALRENLFVAGCDPALGLLAGHVAERRKAGRLHWVEAGSGAALDLVADRRVHLGGVHLYDEESGEHNVAPVRRRLGGRPLVLVNLALWEQGLAVPAGNPKQLRRVADLARRGVRLVGREPGSGAQELLHRLAAEEGVPRRALTFVAAARGHLAVARAVAAGVADAGIATQAAAFHHGLDFVPLAEARFDLVLPRAPAGADLDPRLDRLLDVLGGPRFKRDLGSLTGYGTTRTGQIVAEVAA